ncbi:MAG: BatA domain-containing protein [Planctomycetales bacterium]
MNFTPLLASPFATPALLWGLALGAAPILIHLLSRRKFKETQWAAMRFLLEAVRKNSRRLRREQIILLLVRTMLLVLVVLALAEPLFEQLGAFFQPRRPVHKIIVIDASASMALQAHDVALFDRARQIARSIVESGHQGDAFNLARLSNLAPTVIVATPAYQGARIVEEIEQLSLPHGRGDLANCLQKIDELLKSAPDLPQKEIYLISDFQRATWSPESADDAARVKGFLRKFDDAGRLVLIDLGQAEGANVAVTAVRAADPFATTSRPARFQASIRNYGLERVTGRVVEFLIDDRLIEQRALEINAGAEVVEDFSHLFAAGGEHRVLVRLQNDALPLDDQRWLAVPVKERLRVLCVSGRGGNSASRQGSGFLELALAPFADGPRLSTGGVRGLIEPTVISEGELLGLELAQYDCVFFCDVPLFTDREARLIETYLRGGGGVVWCLGGQVASDNYNQALYRDGAGILPARLEEVRGDPVQRPESFGFDPGEFTHPLINVFQGNPDAGLETTQTYAYYRVTVPPGGRSKTALWFDTGDPALVESRIGPGHSVLVTTSVDDRWGVWPLWPSFLPMIQELVLFAASGEWGERQRLVGEPLGGVIPATAFDAEVSVARPDGRTEPALVTTRDSVSEIRFDGTSVSGVYDVQFAAPLSRSQLFAVNVDPRESNPVKYLSDELGPELLPGVEFDYLTSWEEDLPRVAEAPAASRSGLTRWLLYGALYLLFVEQMMAWSFRPGLWMLCPPLLLVDLARGKGRF